MQVADGAVSLEQRGVYDHVGLEARRVHLPHHALAAGDVASHDVRIDQVGEGVRARWEARFDQLDLIVAEVNSTLDIFGDCRYVTPDDIFEQTCQSNI